ncbi:MAG: S1 family peptidase [Solirubrobacterales bacterium]
MALAAFGILALPSADAAAKKRPAARPIATIKGVQKLESTALRRWPGSFGGIWLSQGKLFIAFTDKSKKRTKKLRRPLVKKGRKKGRLPKRRFRAVTVDDSLLSLRELEGRMIADRDAPPRTTVIPPPPGIVPLPPTIVTEPKPQYDLKIDVMRNSVVAISPTVTPELVDTLRTKYGDVLVEQGPLAEPQGCTRDSCPPFLRSGLVSVAESGTGCSLAFGVLYQPGVTGILSAAHCGNPDADLGDDRSHGGVVYGQVVAEQQSGKVDAELHSVGNGLIFLFPMIYRNDTDYAAIVGKVGTYDGLLVGSTVCKSGYKTGESCGPVLSKTYSPSSYVPGANDFIQADYCSDHGDSGAGVYSSFLRQKPNKKKPVTRYEALGIHSGGAKDTPCSSPQHYALFGHIEFVQSALGVKVLANPN